MAVSITLSDGWSLLKSMIGNINAIPEAEITNADVKKFLQEADLNKDGKVTQDEFIKSCEKSSDYKELEEKYMATFKEIAKLDKDCSSISLDDIDNAVEEIEEIEAAEETQGVDAPGGNGAGTDPPGGTNPPPKDPPDTGVKPVTLTGDETPADLRAGRSDMLNQLQNMRDARNEVRNSEEYKAATDARDKANENHSKSLEALANVYKQKEENGKQLTEQEKAIVDLQAKKVELDKSHELQKQAISDLEGNISTSRDDLANVETSLSNLQEPSTSLIVDIVDEQGNVVGQDTSAYDTAMDAYNAEKQKLEAEKAELESSITDMEKDLGTKEQDLETFIAEQLFPNESNIAKALETLNETAQQSKEIDEAERKAVEDSAKACETYLNSWSDVETIEQTLLAQNEADTKQLRENLKVYDDALDKYDEEQNATFPEGSGLHSSNGFVFEGEGEDKKLMLPVNANPESESGYDLPDGYKIVDGKVLDKDGKEVGKVVQSAGDGNGDGEEKETIERVYLYADSVTTVDDNIDPASIPAYKMSTDAKDYEIEEPDAAQLKTEYIDAFSSDEDRVIAILDAAGNGKLTDTQAKFLLSTVSNGDTEGLISGFEANTDNPVSAEIVEQLNGIFSSIETQAETRKNDIQVAEYLEDIEDEQMREMYAKVFEVYDFESFNDRSDIPQIFNSDGEDELVDYGLSSVAMIASYYAGQEISPDTLLKDHPTDDSATLMETGLKNVGVGYSTLEGQAAVDGIDEILASGKPFVVKVGADSKFTDTEHYIVVTGQVEDGKYVVNDPNLQNYYNEDMVDGFTNGFTKEEIIAGLEEVYVFDDKK